LIEETGEYDEQRPNHEGGEAERFYRVSFAKTLSTLENALTLQCERRTRYANRDRKGRPRQDSWSSSLWFRHDICIRTDSECAGFGASAMKLS